MSFHHFTRSKALRPGVSDSDEGDVEPDVVAPSAATHPVSVPPSSQEIVRSKVETMERSESMSAELAEPVPVPATPFPEETSPPRGEPGLQGSAGLLPAGIPLGCPGSQADPTTPARGQTRIDSRRTWNIDRSRCSRRPRTLRERRLQLVSPPPPQKKNY